MSLNLGGITFGLDANTSGLSTAQSKLQAFGDTVASAMKNTKGAIDETTSALIRQEGQAVRGLMQVQDMIAKINATKIAPEAKVDSIRYLENAYTAYVKALTEPKGSTLNALGAQRVNLGWQENINFINRQIELEKESAAQLARNNYLWSLQREEIAKAATRLEDYQNRLSRQVSAGNISPKQAESLSAGANSATSEYVNQLRSSLLTHEQLTNAQLKLRNSMNEVTRDMREAAAATHPFVQGLSNLSNIATLIGGPFGSFATQLQQSHQLMSENTLATGALLTGFAALAAGALGMVGAITSVTIEYEKVVQTQTAVSGSTAYGAAQFQFLVQVANQAGLSISTLTPAFNRFIASAVGSGSSVHEADQQFKNLAVTFGVMHLSSQDSANALKAFDEIMSRGYVTSRDLVTRLSNDFPGAMSIAKLATGATGAELDKMLKAGQVNGPAFVKAFQEAAAALYHIDLSKSVDTLQASLERIHNKWDVFILSVSQAMGASQSFKNILAALGEVLDWLGSHAQLVLSAIAGLAGALAGLAVAQVAIGIVTALGSGLAIMRAGITAATTAYYALTSAIRGGTIAMAAFDAASIANPIGIMVALVATLTAVIWGAASAFNAVNKAIDANNTKLVDFSSVDAYITKAKDQKIQIDEVTNSLLKQVEAQAAASDQQLQGNNRQLMDANATVANWQARVSNAGGHATDYDKTQLAEWKRKAEGLQRLVDSGIAEGLRTQGRISDLENIQHLPSDNTIGKGGTKETKDPKGSGIAGLDALIAKAKGAEAELANLWKGPPNEALLQAFEKTAASIEAIGDDAKKQALAADKLGVSWDNVASRMDYLNTKVVLTSNAVKDFTKIWEDVHKSEGAIKGINDEIAALGQNIGKDNPGKSLAEGMKQAQTEMAKLSQGALKDIFDTIDRSGTNPNDNAASKAFAVKAQAEQTANLVTFLRAQGIAVKDLATDYDTALNALAKFYAGEQKAKETLANLTNAEQALRDMRKQNTTNSALINGAQSGAGGLQNAQNQQTASSLFSQFGLAGAAAGNAYAVALGTQQRVNDALKVTQGILDGQIKSWQSFGSNGVNALEGVILGTTKLRTALNTVLKDFITTMANTAFFDPLKANLSSAIQQGMTGGGWGGFSLSKLFGGANNGAAAAAQTANTAQLVILNGLMTTLIAVQTMNAGGAYIGLAGLMGLAGGGQVNGPGTSTSDSIFAMLSAGEYVVNAKSAAKFMPLLEAINGGKLPGHANGGPIGQITTADLYTSSAGQNGSLQGGSKSHIIDASTTIHVAGNMDSVSLADLKAHLSLRDQQLRAQLPLLIDGRVQDSLKRNRYQR